MTLTALAISLCAIVGGFGLFALYIALVEFVARRNWRRRNGGDRG